MTVLRSLPSTPPPAFDAWPDDVKTRAYELWASIAARSAPRVEHLLSQEFGEAVAVPAGSTIRAWAAQEAWAARADADLAQSHGRTLRELQTGFLAAVTLAQDTLLDAMCGRLDGAPYGGSGRIKAAEIVLRLAERADLRLLGDGTPALAPEDLTKLTVDQRSRLLREQIVAENAR